MSSIVELIALRKGVALGAFSGGIMLGFALVAFTRHQAWYIRNGTTEEGRQQRVLYLLMWEMIRGALARNCKSVDLGPNPNEGVAFHKQGFSARERTIVAPRSIILDRRLSRLYRFGEGCFLPLRCFISSLKRGTR
jgi:hypothetical protein